jgi:nucleotide-binding universal stress UspA family protein
MKNILVAIDYSPTAETVAKAGYELGKALKAQTILLHVVSDPTYYSSLKYSPIFGFDNSSSINLIEPDTDGLLQLASGKYLEGLKKILGDETIHTLVKTGECAESILNAANELEADIIVMGTHSRQGFKKMIMGSIAEKVLRSSSLPLFIIPIKIFDEE